MFVGSRAQHMPQQSISSFVFSLCDFVDRSVWPEKEARSTKSYEQHEPKYFRLEIGGAFWGKVKPTNS